MVKILFTIEKLTEDQLKEIAQIKPESPVLDWSDLAYRTIASWQDARNIFQEMRRRLGTEDAMIFGSLRPSLRCCFYLVDKNSESQSVYLWESVKINGQHVNWQKTWGCLF